MTPAVLLSLIVSVNALIFLVLPMLSRRDIFFAVTVPVSFRDSALAAFTLRRYRILVLIGSALALAATRMAASSPRVIALAALIQTLVSTAAWVWAHRAIRPHAAAPEAIRVASLALRDMSYPGGRVAFVGPYLLLGAAALFMYLNWDLIPDRIPTKWGGTGAAIRWKTKTVSSVFGGFLFGTALVMATQLQTWFLLRRTRQIAATGEAADAEGSFRYRTAQQGVLATYFMAALSTYFSTRSLFTLDGSLGLGFWLIMGAIAVLTVAFTIWYISVGQGGQRRVRYVEGASAVGDASPDRAWKAGLFYFNPDDPAIFVETRMGVGWTLNFGNTTA